MENVNLAYLNQTISNYIVITFVLVTLLTLLLLLNAIKKSGIAITGIAIFLVIWLAFQAFLANKGFYLNVSAKPPHFPIAVILPLLLIISLFATQRGRKFVDALPLKNLTYLHVVRIPVEIVLFWLFLEKQVPQLMTFEGRNFDVLSGITAPIVAYLVFSQQIWSKKALLIWNFFGLILLVNIVSNAILSVPTPFEKFAFDQPNVALLKFPIIWLPSFIVPTVLFAHLVSIRQLIRGL